MEGLYQKLRPATLDEVVGQPEAVSVLRQWGKAKAPPHAILFSGPAGCGKTTLARIVASWLCKNPLNVREYNCANLSGVANVRDMLDKVGMRPMSGDKGRVFLLDECHQLSDAAQNCLLKDLEDTKDYVYFVLATTAPQDLIPTIKTRCHHVPVKPLSARDLTDLVRKAAKRAGYKAVSNEVIDRIVDAADGSARQALVDLEKVGGMKSEDDQLNAVLPQEVKAAAFDLVRLLLPFTGRRPNWSDVARVLKSVEGQDAERVRRLVLANARTVLLKGGKTAPLAYHIIACFAEPVFHSGHAGLAGAAWEACFPTGKG